MPKIKSHSGAKKRFKRTAKGKWIHRKAGLRHLLTGMAARKGRHMRQSGVIGKDNPEGKVLRRYLPNE